ncbi:LAGLIDADG family homing endonuclease [Candidatus Curtissbacteria bacterium]|nr:LAGLIDADG family homing endonuclease [Candidatus Curtissbacteria bacterium]
MKTVYAYLAGLIDGEGCISIRKTFQYGKDQFKPMVEVGMTDIEPMQLLQKTFGGSYWPELIRGRNLPVTKWRVTGTHVIPVLKPLLKYLLAKKRQAEIALALAYRIHHWPKPMPKAETEFRRTLFHDLLEARKPNIGNWSSPLTKGNP